MTVFLFHVEVIINSIHIMKWNCLTFWNTTLHAVRVVETFINSYWKYRLSSQSFWYLIVFWLCYFILVEIYFLFCTNRAMDFMMAFHNFISNLYTSLMHDSALCNTSPKHRWKCLIMSYSGFILLGILPPQNKDITYCSLLMWCPIF